MIEDMLRDLALAEPQMRMGCCELNRGAHPWAKREDPTEPRIT